METVIATILSITGEAWARDENGNLRQLQPGDQLLAGEVLVTAPNAQVQLDFVDGTPAVTVAGGQEIAMTPDLAQAQDTDQTDDSSVLDQNVQDIIAALNADGGDQTVDGQQVAPAAGNEGGTGDDAGGGISFVKLTRIASDVNPLQYDYPLPDQPEIDVRLAGADDGGNADALVDDGTPPIDTAPPVDPPIDPPTDEPDVSSVGFDPDVGAAAVEEGGILGYVVTLDSPTTVATTYTFDLSGSADASDYDAPVFTNGVSMNPADGTITVPAGVDEFQVTVSTIDDALLEPNETVTLGIGGVTATGTIADNDGTIGDDHLSGSDGPDVLAGGPGNDVIGGGSSPFSGDDELYGGAGDDVLSGGAGADTFVWQLGDAGTSGTPAQDVVTDFETAVDKLDLSDLLQGEEAAGSDLSDYLHFEDSGADTVIHISSTGGYDGGFSNGATDQTITLTGVQLPGSNDSDIAQQMVTNGQLDVDS